MAPLPLSTSISPLRLVLAGISPMIWRRLLVSSETTIAQLHHYIQVSFDGSGEHWHRFRIHGKDYGIADRGGLSFDDHRITCRSLVSDYTLQKQPMRWSQKGAH